MTCIGARLAARVRPGPCPPGLRVHRARRAGRPLDATANLSDLTEDSDAAVVALSVFMGRDRVGHVPVSARSLV